MNYADGVSFTTFVASFLLLIGGVADAVICADSGRFGWRRMGLWGVAFLLCVFVCAGTWSEANH